MRIWGKSAAGSGWHVRGKAIGLVVAVSMASLPALPSSASATNTFVSPPYAQGTFGYDVSWPNCSATPTLGSVTVSFAIVGIGGGRPFTTSSCAQSEYKTAQSSDGNTTSLYYNTGYVGAYAHDIVKVCTGAVDAAASTSGLDTFAGFTGHALTQAEHAWEIGCSEAQYSFSNAPGAASFWWADVETGNSWSTNTTLNQFAIDGMSYAMNVMDTNSKGVVGGGFYSSQGSWTKITGPSTFMPTPAAATWMTSVACGTTSFAGGTPAVVQNPPNSSVSGNVDVDEAC